MSRRIALLACTLLLLVALVAGASTVEQQKLTRGVRPKDIARYTAATFHCLNGVGSVPAAQVNDEYCDCADGSDEPGTSACVNSRFYCRNEGAKPRILPSSRVNDGICDCCDGTDEVASYSRMSCPNTCEEAGRADREALARDLAAAEAGLSARQQLVAKAQVTLEEKRAKMAHYEKVMAERKVLHEQAKATKEAEEAIEQQEIDRRAAEQARIQAEKDAAEAAAAAAAAPPADQAASEQAAPAEGSEAVPTEVPVTPEAAAEPVTEPTPDAPAAAVPSESDASSSDSAAAAAVPVEEPAAENFPYPAEYAYNPDAAATASSVADSAAGDDVQVVEEESEEDESDEVIPSPGIIDRSKEGDDEYVHPGEPLDDAEAESAADIARDTPNEKKKRASTSPFQKLLSADLWLPLWTRLSGGAAGALESVRSSVVAVSRGEVSWQDVRTHSFTCLEEVGWRAIDALVWAGVMDAKHARPMESRGKASSRTSYTSPASDGWKSSAAEAARAAFEVVDTRLTKLQKKMSDLQKVLDRSYGPAGEFMHMDGQCYSLQIKQYTYEVCPYSKAAQKEGSGSTSLGTFDSVSQRDDGRWAMLFKGGQTCWQGPQRSLTVQLVCGATDRPLTVDEPSKCVYEMVMETPAVCNDEHAAKVRQRAETGGEEEDTTPHVPPAKDEL